MQEIIGNLFEPSSYMIMVPPTRGWIPCNMKPDAIIISTNGFVKANGQCVMGRGCAKTAMQKIPGLSSRLGSYIQRFGNRVFDMGLTSLDVKLINDQTHLVAFPVKPRQGKANNSCTNVVEHMRKKFRPLASVPGWAMVADVEIIEHSARQLVELADKRGWNKVVLPRPGCGCGELKWENVKQVVEPILDDRFYCITFPNNPAR